MMNSMLLGQGMVFFDSIFVALLWSAAAFTGWVEFFRREAHDRRAISAFIRRMSLTGLTIQAANVSYRMYDLGDLPISAWALIAQSLWACASALDAWTKLSATYESTAPPPRN